MAQGADGDAVGDYWGPRREHWAASAGRKILGSNYLDRCSTTPLELAAAEGHVDVMKLLLAAGASITGSSESGGSPIHWAAGGGHVEAVDLLLAEGAWIDARPDDQWYDATLIHCAAYFGQVDTVRQLLELGAEIYSQAHVSLVTKHNGPDWYSIQGTPLHAASYMGHPAVVKLLIEAGARISSRNLDGLTALDVARQERRTRVVEVLQAAEKRE